MSATARRILLYGILALCLCAFSYIEGKSDATDDLTIQGGYALLASHTTYQRVQDSLGRLERGFVAEEAFWRRKADFLGRSPQMLPLASNPSSTSRVDSGITQLPTDSLRVVFLGRALDACDASRGAADTALALCKIRVDTLEASLRAVLAVRDCRILFFKCPSRSVLFVGGALVGAILEHRLTH